MKSNIILKIAFFGTSEFSVIILEELKKKGMLPSLIVTAPDQPKGRKLILTPPPVKVWAQENKVEFLQPQKLDDSVRYKLQATSYKLFIVAAYGKIIPKKILDIPQYGTLNVHPSLLPLYRGPSPIQTQILENVPVTGVTIMRIDEEVDHGPILAQETTAMPTPLPTAEDLEKFLATRGGRLLAETIPPLIEDPPAGGVSPQEQDHSRATYTKMLSKEDGLISLRDEPELNYRKIRAFHPWPGAYFFTEKNSKEIRVRITNAQLQDGKLIIKKVIPEGGREMDYKDFLRGNQL